MGYEDSPIYANPQPQSNYAPAPYPNAGNNAQPIYVQPSYTPYHEQGHVHVIIQSKQNNMPLGFACGIFFGIFGLCCALAVEEKTSYLKGWMIAFIILLIIGAIIATISVVA